MDRNVTNDWRGEEVTCRQLLIGDTTFSNYTVAHKVLPFVSVKKQISNIKVECRISKSCRVSLIILI